jgi:hypothetical protein
MTTKTVYEDGTYLDNNPNWHAEDSPWKAAHIESILQKNRVSPSSICEIGCGSGEILNSLSKHYGTNVIFSGYDISPQAFDICKKKEKNNLHFFLKDLLEEQGTSFDVAIACDVFEHVEDYFGFLRKFREKAEYKVFHIPLELCAQAVTLRSGLLKQRISVGHIHHFNKETALATLKDTGYDVLDCFYTKGLIDLPQHGWKTRLLNFPRKWLFALNQDLAVRLLSGFSLMVLAK